LEASGLPLGIFSHATQSASTCGLVPGAALLLVSRGIIEAEHNDREFGLEGAKKSFQDGPLSAPRTHAWRFLSPPSNSLRLLPLTTTSLRWCYCATVTPDGQDRVLQVENRSPMTALAK
jgi:hypothetical protein